MRRKLQRKPLLISLLYGWHKQKALNRRGKTRCHLFFPSGEASTHSAQPTHSQKKRYLTSTFHTLRSNNTHRPVGKVVAAWEEFGYVFFTPVFPCDLTHSKLSYILTSKNAVPVYLLDSWCACPCFPSTRRCCFFPWLLPCLEPSSSRNAHAFTLCFHP